MFDSDYKRIKATIIYTRTVLHAYEFIYSLASQTRLSKSLFNMVVKY